MWMDRITYFEQPSRSSARREGAAIYHFCAIQPEQSSILLDHEFGEVLRVDGSRGLSIHQEEQGTRKLIMLESTWHSDADTEHATLHIQWDEKKVLPPAGFPLRILPTHLPEPITEHSPYPYAFDRWPDPEPSIPSVRLEVDPELLSGAGVVRDAQGGILMAAVPIRADLQASVWYTDDRIILAGDGWDILPIDRRLDLRDRALEIHAFLAEEFGHGDLVRAFILSEAGALRQSRGVGQAVVLTDTMLEGDRRWFIAERHLAEQMACMWWTYGVRFGGREGAAFTLGLALYSAFRWFEVSGKSEQANNELEFWRKWLYKIESSAGTQGGQVVRYSLQVALSLQAYAGPALRQELRRWCERDWGCSVHMKEISRRLGSLGIELPVL